MSTLDSLRYGDVLFRSLPRKAPEPDFWERAATALAAWSPWSCKSEVKVLSNGQIAVETQEISKCQIIFRKVIAYTILSPLTLSIWAFFKISTTYALRYEWLLSALKKESLPPPILPTRAPPTEVPSSQGLSPSTTLPTESPLPQSQSEEERSLAQVRSIEVLARYSNYINLIPWVEELSPDQIPRAFNAIKGDKRSESHFFLVLLRRDYPLSSIDFSYCYEDLYLALKSSPDIHLPDFIKLVPLLGNDIRTWHIVISDLYTALAACKLRKNYPLTRNELSELLKLSLTKEAERDLRAFFKEPGPHSPDDLPVNDFRKIESDDQFYAFYYWLQSQMNSPQLKELYRFEFLCGAHLQSVKLYVLAEPECFSDLNPEKRLALIGWEGICSDEERAYILLHNPKEISFFVKNGVLNRTLAALPWINEMVVYLENNFIKFVFQTQRAKPFGNRLSMMKEIRKLTQTDPLRAQKLLDMLYADDIERKGDLLYAFLSGLEGRIKNLQPYENIEELFNFELPSPLPTLIDQSEMWQRVPLPMPQLIFLLRRNLISQEELRIQLHPIPSHLRPQLDRFMNAEQRGWVNTNNNSNS